MRQAGVLPGADDPAEMKPCTDCRHAIFEPPSYANGNEESYRVYRAYWTCQRDGLNLSCDMRRRSDCGAAAAFFEPRET